MKVLELCSWVRVVFLVSRNGYSSTYKKMMIRTRLERDEIMFYIIYVTGFTGGWRICSQQNSRGSHILYMQHGPCINVVPTQHPIQVLLPDGSTITSTHTGLLPPAPPATVLGTTITHFSSPHHWITVINRPTMQCRLLC
jgi:hypothetical protein